MISRRIEPKDINLWLSRLFLENADVFSVLYINDSLSMYILILTFIVFEQFVEKIVAFSPTEIGFSLKCGLLLKERMER